MRIEDIQEHLDKYNDYDIRKNKNCRKLPKLAY